MIGQATPSVAVVRAGGTYNGSSFAAAGSVSGVGGAGLGTPTFTYYAGTTAMGTALAGAPVNAGTYTVLASYAGGTNYTAASASTTFTIAKATPTVTVSATSTPFSAANSRSALPRSLLPT